MTTDARHLQPDVWRGLGADGAPLAAGHGGGNIPRHGHDDEAAGMTSAAFDRRRLMQLMGASIGLAGLGGCNSGTQYGAPLMSQPRSERAWAEGAPVIYATALELGGIARGVLVETVDGRPVKIEGNPRHPGSLGATDAFMQAEILSLYDPDRSSQPLERGRPVSWQAAHAMLREVGQAAEASGGRGLHVLMGASGSPTQSRLIRELAAVLPGARVFHHDPIGPENTRLGARLAFGRDIASAADLTTADVVLSFGDDLLGAGPDQVRHGAAFAERRRRGRQSGRMPHLIVAESTPSLTGARADLRLPLSPREIERLAFEIAAVLGLTGEVDGGHRASAQAIAAELSAAGAAALVSVGRAMPPAVHAIAHAINAMLGAVGRTVRYRNSSTLASPAEPVNALRDALATGEVTTFLCLGANPAYDVPSDCELASLIAGVPLSVHVAVHAEETAHVCRWHLPAQHVLESWGDATAFDGTASIVQPVTTPLVEAVSALEVLSGLMGKSARARDLVRATWVPQWGGEAEQRWQSALIDGVIAGSESPEVRVELSGAWNAGLTRPPAAKGLAVAFVPDPAMWDGRFAGNAWLQELPKPLTQQVWGNAALMAAGQAMALGLRNGDVVRITGGERTIEAPVLIVPGHAERVITLPLGYGRAAAGPVGSGVGFNAYELRSSAAAWGLDDITLVPAKRRVALVTTQHHHSLEGRDIVRVALPADAGTRSEPAPALPSLYPDHRSDGHAWGMTVDLDACIGCNACVVACQAENNIPVVGPREAAAGREMHWLRIDLYYSGSPAAPQTWFQPVLCMHCEKAPCEVVCPVNATVHSSEGLNDMVYNRCIGTRTCSNNCPYKVRRFNWFDYARREPGKEGARLNPDVTVRPRGVMEKCTFCTQRISAARIAARIEGRPVRDGDIVTACQQACPARVFTFGDVNDRESAVSRSKQEGRNYALLGELSTRPRTTYLARIAARGGEADGT
jgi:Fe-S-cluster-containing dehydrogenase component/anaerobic selenocysteine-containing dehydrogenase